MPWGVSGTLAKLLLTLVIGHSAEHVGNIRLEA